MNLRFYGELATIPLPCFLRTDSNRGVPCTLQCRGCLFAFYKAGGHGYSDSPRDRVYSHSDFLKHLEQCPSSRVVVEYLEMKLRGDNLNFKTLGEFQRLWDLSNNDLVCLGGFL